MRKIQVFITDPQFDSLLAQSQKKGISLSESVRRIIDNCFDSMTQNLNQSKQWKIKGHNEFYSGWLSYLLQLPQDLSQTKDWQNGWRLVQETGERAVSALPDEIRLGHIIVD